MEYKIANYKDEKKQCSVRLTSFLSWCFHHSNSKLTNEVFWNNAKLYEPGPSLTLLLPMQP